MVRKLFIAGAMLGLLVLSMGCSKEQATQTEDINNNTNNDLIAQEFDGLNTSSEAPNFGDETIVSSDIQEQDYSDSYFTNPVVDSLMRNPDIQVFHFRAMWGRIPPDSTITASTDWTGSLTLSRGFEVIRKVIGFEQGDTILPRTQRNLIEWISTTITHADGIAVDVIIPKPRLHIDTTYTYIKDSTGDSTLVTVFDTLPVPPVSLEFKTGPYTRTFSLDELARLDTIIYLSDSNAVAFNAFQVNRIQCPKGFLSGSWGYDSTGLGIFRGIWINHKGRTQGSFKGHFLTDTSGQNIFVGKWIDTTGKFEGLLKGTWKDHPNTNANSRAHERAGGWFAGRIYDTAVNPIGIVMGNYMTGGEAKPGFLMGRWKLDCPYENPNGAEVLNDGMNGKNIPTIKRK